MTFVILKVLDMVMGLRVSEEDEIAGLDASQHGERAYLLDSGGPVRGIPDTNPVRTGATGVSSSATSQPDGLAEPDRGD